MRRVALGILLLVISSIGLQGTSAAQTPTGKYCDQTGCSPQVTGDGDSFQVGGTTVDLDEARGRATPGGAATAAQEWTELEEYLTPACGTNGLHGDDALCMAAVSTCAAGELRWWIWHRVIRAERQPDGSVVRTPGEWERLPGSYCLGADDPGVPDYGRAIARVQSGFQDLPLPRAAVEVAPAPTSLVQVPTAFFAGGVQSFEQTVTPVPGISVTVRARPTSWTWYWGDGSSGTFGTAGEPRRPVVAHTYRQAGDFSAFVEVTWQGSFTIAGSSEVFDITTPAVVTSAPVTVQVREARSQLVDQS